MVFPLNLSFAHFVDILVSTLLVKLLLIIMPKLRGWLYTSHSHGIYTGLSDNAVSEEVAQAFNITPPFRLGDFTYNNNKLVEIIFRHLSSTSFDGITVR